MPSQFAAVTNKEISQLIKQAVPEIHEGYEVRFGRFNRQNFVFFAQIYKTNEKVFLYKYKLSLVWHYFI